MMFVDDVMTNDSMTLFTHRTSYIEHPKSYISIAAAAFVALPDNSGMNLLARRDSLRGN